MNRLISVALNLNRNLGTHPKPPAPPRRHKFLTSLRTWIVLAALPTAALGADLAFDIPPVPVALEISGQPVSIVVSGNISGESQRPLNLNLHADLTDLQSHMTPLLQTELNQSNRCGERISVEKATLVPAAPAGRLTVQLHFEKWACFKAFGKENTTRLLGGNGTVQVLLTPQLDEGQTLRLDAEIGDIDADGSLGQMLHSEYGAVLRDKIREALVKAIQKSAGLEAVVPAKARPFVTIQSVAFAERGTGILTLNLAGKLTVPLEQASSLLEQFRNR
jgi:hypothetical protein